MTKAVALTQIINDNQVLHVSQGRELLASKAVSVSDVYRPGLELTGYFDFYPRRRLQLLGRTEISYAARLDPDMRSRVFARMCTPDTPCFLVARNLPIPKELVAAAETQGIPILH